MPVMPRWERARAGHSGAPLSCLPLFDEGRVQHVDLARYLESVDTSDREERGAAELLAASDGLVERFRVEFPQWEFLTVGNSYDV
jgi:hypothetical protein